MNSVRKLKLMSLTIRFRGGDLQLMRLAMGQVTKWSSSGRWTEYKYAHYSPSIIHEECKAGTGFRPESRYDNIQILVWCLKRNIL